jgi:hypothetical protein
VVNWDFMKAQGSGILERPKGGQNLNDIWEVNNMINVISHCHICGRTMAVKYLRLKTIKTVKMERQGGKINVCVSCCKKLESPIGIPQR